MLLNDMNDRKHQARTWRFVNVSARKRKQEQHEKNQFFLQWSYLQKYTVGTQWVIAMPLASLAITVPVSYAPCHIPWSMIYIYSTVLVSGRFRLCYIICSGMIGHWKVRGSDVSGWVITGHDKLDKTKLLSCCWQKTTTTKNISNTTETSVRKSSRFCPFPQHSLLDSFSLEWSDDFLHIMESCLCGYVKVSEASCGLHTKMHTHTQEKLAL